MKCICVDNSVVGYNNTGEHLTLFKEYECYNSEIIQDSDYYKLIVDNGKQMCASKKRFIETSEFKKNLVKERFEQNGNKNLYLLEGI